MHYRSTYAQAGIQQPSHFVPQRPLTKASAETCRCVQYPQISLQCKYRQIQRKYLYRVVAEKWHFALVYVCESICMFDLQIVIVGFKCFCFSGYTIRSVNTDKHFFGYPRFSILRCKRRLRSIQHEWRR